MVFMTYTNCEKAAKTRLDKMGIENYLPVITVHSDTDKKFRTELQFASTIFARCDLRKYPSLNSHQNFLLRPPNHAGNRENQVLLAMEACWRVEKLSEKFDVERVKSDTKPGMACTIKSGSLSGSEGYCDDTRAFFFLPLTEMNMYAKMPLSAKYVIADAGIHKDH